MTYRTSSFRKIAKRERNCVDISGTRKKTLAEQKREWKKEHPDGFIDEDIKKMFKDAKGLERSGRRKREVTKKLRVCSECSKIWTKECDNLEYFIKKVMFKTDAACPDFKAKVDVENVDTVEMSNKTGLKNDKEDAVTLALDREKPTILKPSGFYDTMLIEPTYLVYLHGSSGATEVRPSLIIIKKEKKPQICDFMADLPYDVRGTFPSEGLSTLLTVGGVRKLMREFQLVPNEILDAVKQAVEKHVMVAHNPAYPILLKYWILGSFFFDVFDAFPIFGLLGSSESGKSRVLALILALAYHASGTIDPTEAGIFRTKEEEKATLCMDEAEYLTSGLGSRSMINTLINASYSNSLGMAVTRVEEENGKRIRKRFDLYSPMAIACVSGFSGITGSRMITLITKRVQKDYPKAKESSYNDLRDNLYLLRFHYAFTVKEEYDKIDVSNIVSARFSELFKPLFALIKVFGTDEEWKIMSEYATEYQELSRAEALNVSDEEEVLTTLWEMEPEEGNWYSLKDLTDKVNRLYGTDLRTQRTSNILKRLGFTKRRRATKGRVFLASKGEMTEAANALGIPLLAMIEAERERQAKEAEKIKNRDWRDA